MVSSTERLLLRSVVANAPLMVASVFFNSLTRTISLHYYVPRFGEHYHKHLNLPEIEVAAIPNLSLMLE